MASNTPDASGLVERLEILLPPAADVEQRYLDGWCEGQAYLIANHCSDEQFDEAITATDHITTLTARVAEQDAEIARLSWDRGQMWETLTYVRYASDCEVTRNAAAETLDEISALEAKP